MRILPAPTASFADHSGPVPAPEHLSGDCRDIDLPQPFSSSGILDILVGIVIGLVVAVLVV